MKMNTQISENTLYFSRWCGKGYAVFAALGRQVRIAELALHICLCAMLKSAREGLIVNMASVWEEGERVKADAACLVRLFLCCSEGEVCADQNNGIRI